jgi:hypothetical protein
VFILKHYFTLKSFAAVHEAFSNVYLSKKVSNKATIHQMVTNCQWILVFQKSVNTFSTGKGKAVPQHTYGGTGGRGDTAPTHSRPWH